MVQPQDPGTDPEFAAIADCVLGPKIRPIVPQALAPGCARVPGTRYEFDPATAAFFSSVANAVPMQRIEKAAETRKIMLGAPVSISMP